MASSSELMLIILSPLCSLIPKLLAACAKQLAQMARLDTNAMGESDKDQIKVRFLRGDTQYNSSFACDFTKIL